MKLSPLLKIYPYSQRSTWIIYGRFNWSHPTLFSVFRFPTFSGLLLSAALTALILAPVAFIILNNDTTTYEERISSCSLSL